MDYGIIEGVDACFYSAEQPHAWMYRKIVNERQLTPLCGQDISSFIIPGFFFVPFLINTSEDEIIKVLGDCAFDEAVQRAYTLGRNALRSEKVRPWGLRTYRPFRGQLQDAKPSFMEMVEIAEEVIDEIGVPMAPKSRGRRRKYDWKQILAVLLCKGV